MKKYLLVLAACALTTACVEHEKTYEEETPCACAAQVVETKTCGCEQKAPACGCHKHVAPAPAPVVPVVQPKTVVVVVPSKQPVAPEIVYPEPKCGCKAKK